MTDSIGLVLFLFQEWGVTLAVGSSTFALLFYVTGTSRGMVDASQTRFMRSVFTLQRIGLALIIATGVLISAAHYFAGETAVLLVPAYLFKWILVLIVVVNATLMDFRVIPEYIGGPLSGASWYALFVVHTLAFVGTWFVLIGLYVVWLVVFFLLFTLFHSHAKRMYHVEGAQKSGPPLKTSYNAVGVIKPR